MRSTLIAVLSTYAVASQASAVRRQPKGDINSNGNSNAGSGYTGSDTVAEDHFRQVCLAGTELEPPTFDAPCAQFMLISDECQYGSDSTWSNVTHEQPAELGARDQQVCICESEFFQAIQGCTDCVDKHGLTGVFPDFQPSALSSFSSSYCAVTNTPVSGWSDNFVSAFSSIVDSSYPILTATTYTDPLGNNTAVSAYFTPSVTGAAAYSVSYNGVYAVSGSTITPSVNTANGQIVPTAVAAAAAAGTSATTTTKSSAVEPTAAVDRLAVAGLIGLAAVVAAL